MDRLFRIDFYPQDWIIDTARLSLEERGIYIQIISLIYSNRGPIENDASWIAGVSGCSPRMAKSLINRLSEIGFIHFSGSKISQKRAENELKTKREMFEHGAKGGRTKAENEALLKENNEIASSQVPIGLGSPSPSPSPSPKSNVGRDKSLLFEKDRFKEFWEKFPKQRAGSKTKAGAAYRRALKRVPENDLITAVENYRDSREVAEGYAKGAEAWLNDDRWTHDYTSTPKGNHNGKSIGEQARDLLDELGNDSAFENPFGHLRGPESIR